ncbi:DUF4249 family protein [Salisaeta longa]|uniref:DUF4249 family protein n=1 Tax=Salisaeta longa TaxID=503170 RepID=UPI0003B4C88A|nr:DUF4249 family protein [Salisaeta longa]
MRRCLLLLLLVGSWVGCDTASNDVRPEAVVQSYQVAGDSLAPVWLSRAAPVNSTDPLPGLTGATVVVERLGADGQTVQATYPYVAGDSAGVYVPVTPGVQVAPRATYRLRATLANGTRLQATTTVPDTFSIVRATNPTVPFRGGAQPSFRITRSDVGARPLSVIFSVTSQLDFTRPDSQLVNQLTPFYADSYDPAEQPIEELRLVTSGLLNAANFTTNPDGTITVDLPWIGVAFYGPNRVAISVPDDNLFDMLRSQTAQQGALAPGEIPNIIEHVEGGTGVFGSYARVQQAVRITRPE